MNKLMKNILILSSIIFFTACSSQKSLYYWGNYPDTIYSYYNDNGDFTKQEKSLTDIIQNAQKDNKQVGPGVYGQLGLVYSKQGKMSEAQSAWQKELDLYPESERLIHFLQSKKAPVTSTVKTKKGEAK